MSTKAVEISHLIVFDVDYSLNLETLSSMDLMKYWVANFPQSSKNLSLDRTKFVIKMLCYYSRTTGIENEDVFCTIKTKKTLLNSMLILCDQAIKYSLDEELYHSY